MADYDDVEILLVEDNRTDADLAIRALQKSRFGHKLFWVQDGVEALDFVRCRGDYGGRDPRQLPRLVLLDLKMPRLDGLDVLRELKADPATCSIPIVVLTSSNQPRDLIECYRLGANGYVTKPIKFGGLQEAIMRIGTFWLLCNQVP